MNRVVAGVFFFLSVLVPIGANAQSHVGMENGHEYVDLGLSVKWATCNVGAKTPQGYGIYYAWGEIVEKIFYFTWKTYKFRADGDSTENVTFSKYNTDKSRGRIDNNKYLDEADDVARVQWGGSWRIPSYEDIQELIENCTWTWTTRKRVPGYLVTSRKPGYTDSSIFLPAGGYRADNKIFGEGKCGCYWSRSLDSRGSYRAFSLAFPPGIVDYNDGSRFYGQSVRPVCR